jgi:ubiquinone/menaquinone biosynthesis C-methylase UbiE
MKVFLPDQKLLIKTGEVDYYNWNYKFPISLVQKYRFRKIVQLLGGQKYNSMLEFGTGSGIFLPELSKHCNKLYACDVHDRFDHIEKMLMHYKIKDYELSSQCIEETNYPDGFFDVIVANSVLEFVEDLDKAISEIKRIMKNNGVFITICPMENKFLDYLLSFYTLKPPKDEFGKARQLVGKSLESNFDILTKGYMIPLIGKYFPVYTHYKLINNKG